VISQQPAPARTGCTLPPRCSPKLSTSIAFSMCNSRAVPSGCGDCNRTRGTSNPSSLEPRTARFPGRSCALFQPEQKSRRPLPPSAGPSNFPPCRRQWRGRKLSAVTPERKPTEHFGIFTSRNRGTTLPSCRCCPSRFAPAGIIVVWMNLYRELVFGNKNFTSKGKGALLSACVPVHSGGISCQASPSARFVKGPVPAKRQSFRSARPHRSESQHLLRQVGSAERGAQADFAPQMRGTKAGSSRHGLGFTTQIRLL